MGELSWWGADPLLKVFRDTPTGPAVDQPVLLEGAINEWVSGQVVLFSFQSHLIGVRLSASEFEAVGHAAPSIPPPRVRVVGWVPVRHNSPDTPSELLVRPAPDFFPDPLFDQDEVHIPRDQAQPLWLTVRIPDGARPGRYKSVLQVRTRYGQTRRIEILLDVHPAVVPEKGHLKVSNWLELDSVAERHGVALFSERFWEVLREYARVMGEHRQNVMLTPLFELIRPQRVRDEIRLDFSHFDRYIETFDEFGVAATIEGGHLAQRAGDIFLSKELVVRTWDLDADMPTLRLERLNSPKADAFLAWFLPQLKAHLQVRGWSARYVQHLADEPVAENAHMYNELARRVRNHWPELRFIDANMCQDIDGLDTWIPILHVWHKNAAFYRDQQAKGRELWFYTCLRPVGAYANRFIDYPTLKVRLLHWLNARYGATGYLHWGLNAWKGVTSPFLDVESAHTLRFTLPPGDCGILYPGPSGPLSSIRFEAMRDGIVDYELLHLLAEVDPAAADALARRVVQGFDTYDLEIVRFHSVRRELLDAVAKVQRG